MSKPKTYNCPKCDSTDLEWFADAGWDHYNQRFCINKLNECWCNDCNEFIEPKMVPLVKQVTDG